MAIKRKSPSRRKVTLKDAESDMEESADDDVDTTTEEPMPVARGRIAQVFGAVPLAEQRQTCQELLSFLKRPRKDLYQLNEDSSLSVAMLHVHRTMTVRIVYGLGVKTPSFKKIHP